VTPLWQFPALWKRIPFPPDFTSRRSTESWWPATALPGLLMGYDPDAVVGCDGRLCQDVGSLVLENSWLPPPCPLRLHA